MFVFGGISYASIDGIGRRKNVILTCGGGVALDCGCILMKSCYGSSIIPQFKVHWKEIINSKALEEDFGSGEIIGPDS